MTDVSALEVYAGTLSESAQRSKAASGLQHQIMHGDAQTDVLTESGPVPTLAKQARLYSEAIPDAVTELSAQMTDGKIHDSEEEGRNKVGDGQYFYVKPTNPLLFSRSLYKRINAQTSIHIVDDASAASVAKIGDTANSLAKKLNDLNSTKVAVQVEDDFNFVLLKLLNNGALDFLKGRIGNDTNGLMLSDRAGNTMARFSSKQSNINGLVVEPISAPGVRFVDDYGFVLPGGNFSGLGTRVDPTPSAPTELALSLNQQWRTDHMHIIGYGQSLSRGAYSLPVISLTQPFYNLMLAGGTKARAMEAGYDNTSYVPLIESVKGNDGETPVTALCNGLVRRAVADGENAADWVFIGSSPGMGGQTVEALGPGGLGYYEKTIQLIKDSAALSASMGKSYSVWAYCWDQGESNYSTTGSGRTGTKSAYQYAQLQLELFDAMSREIAKISSQKFRPYAFTYQVAGHRKYGRDSMPMALAQWRVSRQRPDVVMVVPAYIFPTHTDLLHLTNEASWLLGEYRSRAMYETMIRRNGKWRPLEPETVDWQAGHIDIKFHVPSGQLVLDAALVAETPNYGFDIREAGALVADLISGVEVTGRDTVRLTLSREASVDALLSYARGRPGDPNASGPVIGARGNLRDTHGLYDKGVSPLGNTFDLHNWCVMFEFDRKNGF